MNRDPVRVILQLMMFVIIIVALVQDIVITPAIRCCMLFVAVLIGLTWLVGVIKGLRK